MSKEDVLETKETKLDSPPEAKTKAWTPTSEQIADFKQDIIRAYEESPGVYDLNNSKRKPKIPDQFLEQYAQIGVFLEEKGQFVKQLIALNKLLAKEAESHESTSKVLRTVLERELAVFGFQPHMGKAHDFLMPSMFREILRHGLIFKDPGLRAIPHGDFTHAIQWLMIAWQHRDSHFLGGSQGDSERVVVNIYKSLGQDAVVISSKKQSVVGLSTQEFTIWDMLVDRRPSTYEGERPILGNAWELDPECFCSAENLHIFILKNDIPELNFLKTIITKRENKREMEELAKNQKSKQLIDLELKNSKNPHYFFYSPLPVQLPTALIQNEKNSLRELTLKFDINDEKHESSPIGTEDYMQYLMTAQESLESGNYRKAIKFFLKSENFYTQEYPQSAVLQNIFYYLGFSYKETQNIKLADYYFRKALQVSLANLEKNSSDQKDLIPLSKVMTELATTQHILRIKPETEKTESTANCIIC